MGRKRILLTVVVAFLVALAGCASFGGSDGAEMAGGDGGDGGGGDAGRQTGGDGARDGASAGSTSEGGDGGGGNGDDGGQASVSGRPLQVDRAIIRTGTVTLRVDEFEDARSAVADRARTLGGYVSGSGSTQHSRHNQTWTTGYVIVRVPSERFPDVLSHARDRGTVLDEETQTKDVTDQLVDLEARLTNLKERRDRLRSFYDRANSTGELLRIEEELSSVQSEIERLEAEKRSLEDRVAFATLRVELNEPAVTPPGDDGPTDPSLVSAFLGSVGTLGDLAYGFLLFSVRLAPFLVVLGVPAIIAGLVARRRLRTRLPWVAGTTGPESSSETEGEPPTGTKAGPERSEPGSDRHPVDDREDRES